MRNPIPVMAEAPQTLTQRLPNAHHGRQKPRLQMLSLLASGQAHSRRGVAPWLGVPRPTLGHWLARYEAGGLTALLEGYVPAGKPLALPPQVLGGLEQALRRPAGVASYEALRPWVKQPSRVAVQYHTLDTIVRTRLKAKLQGPRPSHTQKA